jgi:hypothetical protein
MATPLFCSLIRSLLVACCALGLARRLVSWIGSSQSERTRRIRTVLAVGPVFVSELLIGFHYRLLAAQWSSGSGPWVLNSLTELLYGGLQIVRSAAVGTAVVMLLPASRVTTESLHAFELARRAMPAREARALWWNLRLLGAWRSWIVASCLMALVTFQEFETAALLQIGSTPVSWTVSLFDAQAARQPLADSLRMLVSPLLCELLLLAPAIWLAGMALRERVAADIESADSSAAAHSSRTVAGSSLSVVPGLVFFCVWPVVEHAGVTLAGLRLLFARDQWADVLSQLGTSTAFAIGSAMLAMAMATRVVSVPGTHGAGRWANIGRIAALLPGLCGSLVLSLVLLAMFQTAPLRPLYDSWLPLILGQSLAVLPRAAVIVWLLRQMSDPAALHSARLLMAAPTLAVRRQAATIVWRMTTGRQLLGLLVIMHWCFWDVTVASILRPVSPEPLVTRLYNEMHYGRTEVLLSQALLATTTPLLLAALAMLVSRAATAWRVR